MYIIPDHKFCFLATPRTGSKAVAKVLIEQYGAILVGSHHSVPDKPFENDWLVCSAVRNHWDTLISWWFKIERKGKMKPLAEFLPYFCRSEFVLDRQLFWLNMLFTNRVLRYEQLETDLNLALFNIRLAPVDLPVITDSKRNNQPYQVFYKNSTRYWITEYFKKEIKKYGYKF